MIREKVLTMRRGRFQARSANGFSTVEVLVGATILSVSLAGLAATLPTAQLSVHRGGQNTKATALVQQLLENIRNDPFNQLTLYNGADTRDPNTFPVDNPSPPVPGSASNFQGGTTLTRWKNDIALVFSKGSGITGGYGTVQVVSVATDPGTGNSILDKVTVTVYWSESATQYSIQLATLISGI